MIISYKAKTKLMILMYKTETKLKFTLSQRNEMKNNELLRSII